MGQDIMPKIVTAALLLCTAWSIIGLFKPNAVLFFAHPTHKRSRPLAFMLPLFYGLCIFILALCISVKADRLHVGALLIIGGLLVVSLGGLAMVISRLRREKPSGKPAQEQTLYQVTPDKLGFWGRLNARLKKAEAEAKERKLRNIQVWNSKYTGKYTLDLIDCECTCPDWEKRRAWAPPETPFLLCKHLVSHFVHNMKTEEWPEWMKPYFHHIFNQALDGKGMPVWCPDGAETGSHNNHQYIISACQEEYPWMSILTGMGRFGYNVETRHWAKREKPEDTKWFIDKARELSGKSFGISSEDEADDTRDEQPTLKSEWLPEWKDTLKYLLGGTFSKAEEKEYRELFGGDNECRFNLTMFLSRVKSGPTCIHATQDDYYRPRYETLADTGAVLSGKNIPPSRWLTALSMQEMRALAAVMHLPKSRSKQQLIDAAIAAGDAAIEAAWQSTGMDIDDLFLFDAEAVKNLVAQ
ncbi:MAG: hypothetical protein FWG59_03380 [Betaproteobacteria bacterium]|nr:hypothetical protein [Betaproteobacteria bacterium]